MKYKPRNSFEIAKEALRMVGRFATPPTPKVYEVWYRYAEGCDPHIHRQLAYAVDEAENVSVDQLEQIHDQFCSEDGGLAGSVGYTLADQVELIQAMVEGQRKAGHKFDKTIQAADAKLSAGESESEVQECIKILSHGSKNMRVELERIDDRLESSQAQIAQLQKQLGETQKKMFTDPLTEIGNRRAFEKSAERYLGDTMIDRREVYLVIANLDRLREINQMVGTSGGDRLLQFVARQIHTTGNSARWSRTDGDEFATFLSVKHRDDVLEFAEQIREAFAGKRFSLRDGASEPVSISISIGAARKHDGEDLETWRDRACNLLGEAKNFGRDRSVVER